MPRTIVALLALALAAPALAAPAPAPAAPAAPAPAARGALAAPAPGAPITPAAPAVPAPAAQAPSPILAYVPDDATLAVVVRFGQLTRTDFWKMLTSPEVGLDRWVPLNSPLAVDYAKDVVAAVYWFELERGQGQPLAVPRSGVALEMTRDVRGDEILKMPVLSRSVPGAAVPAYPTGEGCLVALPSPRVVVLVTAEGSPPAEYLARVLARAAGAKEPPGPLPMAALEAPGDVTLAAHVPPALKEAVAEEYDLYRRQTLRPEMDMDRLMGFALYYNLVRMALQAEQVTGSLDLGRDADALRLDVAFAAARMAPFMADLAQALADPLQMGLPAVLGGRPLAEPPAEPFYRAVAEDGGVRLTMTRTSAYRFVNGLARSAEEMAAAESARQASAGNLRTLATAIQTYLITRGGYPRAWADLAREDLIRGSEILQNPALTTHLATGDYALVPLDKASAQRRPWQKVLAYESYPAGAEPPHLNVLFADGHVEYVDVVQFRLLYRQTLESLGRPK
ncbi:MAG: hypothetical protein IMZ66_04625 [Planctomycetes bacterium]|nr:hypothetical protein [Planctomycetota bacterium]